MQDIRGMLLPIPTVFEDDGRIDERLMQDLVDYYVDAGVDALFVGGSFGQGAAMSLEERKQLSSIVIKRVAKRIPAGGSVTVEFRADRPGTFPFYSNLTSDSRHAEMRGQLVVRPR